MLHFGAPLDAAALVRSVGAEPTLRALERPWTASPHTCSCDTGAEPVLRALKLLLLEARMLLRPAPLTPRRRDSGGGGGGGGADVAPSPPALEPSSAALCLASLLPDGLLPLPPPSALAAASTGGGAPTPFGPRCELLSLEAEDGLVCSD